MFVFITAYLLINSVYLCVLPFFMGIFKALLQSQLTPFTKLWMANVLNFVGFGGMHGIPVIFLGIWWFGVRLKTLVTCFVLANAVSIVGLWSLRKWVIRILSYLLIVSMVWGIFWPVIFDRATSNMEVFVFRAFNARVYYHYWEPLKLMYCKECKPSANSVYFVRQYETIYSGRDYRIKKDMAGKFPDSYEQAKLRTEESFLKRAPDAISLAPAYWGIFRMTMDAYQTSRELYEFAMALIKAIFYLWFVIIPGYFLWSINRTKIRALFI